MQNLSMLLRAVTPKHNGDYRCINYLHSFRIENKVKSHKNVSKNNGYGHVKMSEEFDKILDVIKFRNPWIFSLLSMQIPHLYLKKYREAIVIPKKSTTTKISKYTVWGHCWFDSRKSKQDYTWGENCMKKFCKNLGG